MLTFFHPDIVKKFLKLNNLENYTHSFDFLCSLGQAFQKMPYENLTKLINFHTYTDPYKKLRMPEVLFEEYLRYGTGGTCFSMTYFMQTILRACGFKTYPVMADRPLAPNTHSASIIVVADNKYLLDPGFMIDRPLELTFQPVNHSLSHNNIMIGRRELIPIPQKQMRYFEDFEGKKTSPYLTKPKDVTEYTIATVSNSDVTIRYFLKDDPITPEDFLKYWQDSFDWPTMSNLSITTAKNNGYIYARNNFIRTTSREGKTQETVRHDLEKTFNKTFGIDTRIISNAFEILSERKSK